MKLIKCIVLFWFLNPGFLDAQNINKGDFSITSETEMIFLDDLKNDSTAQFVNNGQLHFLQNINNEGGFEHSQSSNTGTVYFDGNWQQIISGSGLYLFNNLEFDNLSDSVLALHSDISIDGFTNFYSGIISVEENGHLIFNEDSDHSFSSELSHVNGVSFKEGTNEFKFPCGDNADYRPASISSASFSTDQFSCQFISENSDVQFPHENTSTTTIGIDNSGYWEIKRTEGDSRVIIGLSYNPSVTSSIITEKLDQVKILKWNEITEHWESKGGVLNASENMVYTPLEINDFGIFTLGLMKESADEITAYNLISPNANGLNDYLRLDGIENYLDNEVTIVNRWGETVFEIEGYDNDQNTFQGYANKGITSSKNPLPDGTYFYIVVYNTAPGITKRKVGFLEIYNN